MDPDAVIGLGEAFHRDLGQVVTFAMTLGEAPDHSHDGVFEKQPLLLAESAVNPLAFPCVTASLGVAKLPDFVEQVQVNAVLASGSFAVCIAGPNRPLDHRRSEIGEFR